MSPDSQQFKPPTPVGQPYQGDASAPSGFTQAGEMPTTPDQSELPPSMRDLQARQYGADQVPTPRPRQAVPISKDVRFAKISLGVGIASILISPLLGPVAIVMGVTAIRRGERRIGIWALSTGIAGTVIGLIVMVLVATGVLPSLDQMLQDLKTQR